MKAQLLFLLSTFFLFWGCKPETVDPTPPRKAKTISIAWGDGQQGTFNNRLADSLVVVVQDSNGNPLEREPVWFNFEGNLAFVPNNIYLTDPAGQVSFDWIPGCTEGIQEAKAYLFSSFSTTATKLDSVTFKANVSEPSGWARACGLRFAISGKRYFRKHDGTIYLVNGTEIYLSPDNGRSWELMAFPPPVGVHSYIMDLEFDSNGGMYVAGRNDGIFYSPDRQSWTQVNHGIADFRDLIDLFVEDTTLFASFYFGGLYRSTDQGQNWEQKWLVPSTSDRYDFIRRHPNGDLYLLDKWDNFWKSADNGDTWMKVPLDHKYKGSSVESFGIDDNGELYLGSNWSTMAVLSATDYQGVVYDFRTPNQDEGAVKDIRFENGIAYFIVQNSPGIGIYTSENWEKLEIGFDQFIDNHVMQDDGSFLLHSFDGTYRFWP